jgi:hypothetical protein
MADVSRNVVAVLLVLVIIVSGLGTWSLLSTRPTGALGLGSTDATVSLTVTQPPRDQGDIQLTIIPEASHG